VAARPRSSLAADTQVRKGILSVRGIGTLRSGVSTAAGSQLAYRSSSDRPRSLLRHTRWVEIRSLGPGDEAQVVAASHLFDGAANEAATRRFLAEAGRHLLIAYVDGHPAGFVSGVEMTHPDKGTEMFLYELGVEEGFRRRGLGRGLVERLRELARERGCYGMWVLTDDNNRAALATYEGSGASPERGQVVLVWTF
jgi:ribosomal protein S18 acetylase RimI-like enzyme